MRILRILLVEDDEAITAVVAEVLAELGHQVCGTATTEAEAVDAAVHHAPDLMLLDVYLRVGSGVAAMASILRRTAMPHIFMTGGSRQGIPANANVLYKPFGVAGLAAALDYAAGHAVAPGGGLAHSES